MYAKRYSVLPEPEASAATSQLRPNCLPSVPDKYRAFLSVEETDFGTQIFCNVCRDHGSSFYF